MAETPPGFEAKPLEVTASFVNHVQISKLGTGLVRLAFGEAPLPDMPFYRTAVIMTTGDARSLMNVFQNVLDVIPPPPAGPRPN